MGQERARGWCRVREAVAALLNSQLNPKLLLLSAKGARGKPSSETEVLSCPIPSPASSTSSGLALKLHHPLELHQLLELHQPLEFQHPLELQHPLEFYHPLELHKILELQHPQELHHLLDLHKILDLHHPLELQYPLKLHQPRSFQLCTLISRDPKFPGISTPCRLSGPVFPKPVAPTPLYKESLLLSVCETPQNPRVQIFSQVCIEKI